MDREANQVETPSSETTAVAPVVGIEYDPVLDEYIAALERIGRDVAGLVEELSDVQLNWRPGEGRWSISENIAHLTATGNVYLPPLDAAIERGFERAMFGGRDFQPTGLGRWFITQMEPPPRRRLRTSRKVLPQRVEGAAALCAGFDAMHAEMIDRLRRSRGLDLARVKVRSPLLPILRFTLGAAFGIIVAHERRHLWQARQVRQELRFPG